MSNKDIVVRSALLCDEVRREYNGDAIIIGVSPIGPTIANEGTTLDRLGLYIDVVVSNIKSVEVRLWNDVDSVSIMNAKFDLPERDSDEFPDGSDYTFVYVMVKNGINVEVSTPGEYTLQLRSGADESWFSSSTFFFPEIDQIPCHLTSVASVDQIICDFLVVGEAGEAGLLNCGDVDENVRAAFVGGDKPKTFGGIKPFNCAGGHGPSPPEPSYSVCERIVQFP